MMFSGQKGPNVLNPFKWKQQGDSSLTIGLLNEVPPEIELSDYRRAPSTGSESPTGFLNGEGLNVEPIADLDLFFERLYSYYCEKGLWCIIIKWIFELLSLAFTICFSGFFLLYVDWNGLRNAKCGMDAVESGIKPCDLSKEALHEHPLTPFTLTKAIIVGYLGIFSIYWTFCFFRFFAQLKETLKIRDFYYNSLRVTDNEIQTLSWALILEKVVGAQSSQQLCVVKNLSVHDVVMRLMRKENYLIGMLNKGVLAFPISSWVLGAGPTVKSGPNGVQYRLILTQTLEWTLNWCILQSMFDRNSHIRSEFISDPKTLKKRLMIVGFMMLLISPFLIIFMLVFLFLRHAEQFYNHPSTASSRRWTNLSKWIFREFNEVDHLFKHRINNSVIHASEYLTQFPSPKISIIAKFISFVSGGFAAILIIIAFLEESLLEGHIFGRNLFWYAAVFGTITAISRAAVTDEVPVLDPQGMMSLVVQHTHYMPKKWRGKENTDAVRMEFETLFQYTVMMLLEEMASIFLTPFLLLFVVPKRVDDILQFIADFSVDIEGVGHVCSFSVFDFQNHGNGKYGSPFNCPRFQRSSQGKMEKSFLSFQSSYPSWEPNAQGKLFLANLEKFREQKLQAQAIRPAFATSRMSPLNLSFRVFTQKHSLLPRESPFNNVHAAYQYGSVRPMDGEHDYPYILDWYYASYTANDLGQIPSNAPGFVEDRNKDLCLPADLRPDIPTYNENWRQNEVANGETWGQSFQERTPSQLDTSTSAPHFGESVLQHNDFHNVGNPSTSGQWWLRNRPQGAHTETSFMEPPYFNREKGHHSDNDDLSYRGLEETQHHNDFHNVGSLSTSGQWWFRKRTQAAHEETSFMEPPNFNWETGHHSDNDDLSYRILEEEENLDWVNPSRLSRTFLMDDDGGDFDLPFDDIYRRHSESPREHWDPADIV